MHRGPRIFVTQVIIGMLSLLLLFLSAGTLLVAYQAKAMANQPGLQRPMNTSTSSLILTDTPTIIPTLTDTPLPTITDTPTPSPTPTNTPSPTPTSTPSPTPTNTPTPKPKPTNTPSSSPVATATSLPHPTTTPGAHATPGVNASATPGSGQSGGQGSTPTDSSTVTSNFGSNNGQGITPDVQNSSLPLLDISGGVLCTIGFLFLLFIGWRQFRKYLLPVAPAKLPPSGASPWSRERPQGLPPIRGQGDRQGAPLPYTGGPFNPQLAEPRLDTPWQQMRNNQGFTPPVPAVANGYGVQTSVITPAQGAGNGLPPYQTQFPQSNAGPPPSYDMNAQHGISAVPGAGGFAPSNGNVPPVTDSLAPVPLNNNNNALSVVPPIMNGQPVTNGQWTGNPTNATPGFNDPYLLETIRQYRDRGRSSGQ